jgi:Ca-activated chloride channel family protein
VSFVWPLALLGLLAVPLLAWWYLTEQRRRTRAAEAFVTARLRPSVAPRGPRWRRHIPMIAFAVALAALIVAAARPQRSVAVPVTDGAVMLVDDVSSSMAATDVAPSRIAAARHAAEVFLAHVPSTVRVGLLAFNQTPQLLQSPTTDRSSVSGAFAGLRAGGHTAIGDAIDAAVRSLKGLRGAGGKRPPGAIVLLSDGTSTGGADPIAAARQAAAGGIPVYTVAVGTSRGTIKVGRRIVPVPLSAGELAQIAAAGKGRAFTAGDAGGLSAVYAGLAKALGHKHVKHEMTASVAGAGLVLLLIGSTLSLGWFGRLV